MSELLASICPRTCESRSCATIRRTGHWSFPWWGVVGWLFIFSLGCGPVEERCVRAGNDKFDAGDTSGAIRDYDEALKHNLRYAPAYFGRGVVKHSQGKLVEAIREYDRAIDLSPDDASIYKNRLSARLDLLDWLQGQRGDNTNEEEGFVGILITINRILVMTDLNKVIGLDPDDWSYNERGRLRYDIGDYRGAIDDFGQALLYDPDASWAYYNRGLAESELKDYSGAIGDYTQAIELDEGDSWAYYKRGLARIETGQRDEGCLDLEKARAMGNTEAERNIAESCR